jgi:hypothetical protein
MIHPQPFGKPKKEAFLSFFFVFFCLYRTPGLKFGVGLTGSLASGRIALRNWVSVMIPLVLP